MNLPDPKQWLKAETEFDHGPMETWDQEVKDKFYRDLGFLQHFVTSNQKEVMPVKDIKEVKPKEKTLNLTSPANVLSGCGATPEQVERVRALSDSANQFLYTEDHRALEALLAEREKLFIALTKIAEIKQCDGPGCIHCEGDEDHPPSIAAKIARKAIDAAMKGEQ